MATQLYPNTGNIQFNDPLPTPNLLGIDIHDLHKIMELAGLLHSSLEIKTVLEYFIEAVKLKLTFQNAHYHNEELRMELQFNELQKHTCSYTLSLAEQSLGKITFSNKKPFTQKNLEILENMLCHLVHPLRNAILYQKALKAAHHDALTGINNRAAMDQVLKREVELAHRHNTPLSLIVLDIDFFKSINDQYGHKIGDKVLQHVAACVNEHIRACDILFRYGGEEFVVLLTNTDLHGAEFVAERVRTAVAAQAMVVDASNIPVQVSLGVADLVTEENGEQLFTKADAALYEAKRGGRNQTVLYSTQCSENRVELR